ncbi:hypothetical protein JYG23_14630 [Sedimentibacter sp. zth1]|uniref:hypothetical protein n=1 Tax=Sedimentibacter sp. zth1 TaxID=2816908 RepID=UPI001A934CF3|nr:hypothetical protein [Sedimentibacter sp. zth1]QSX05877.1 hypothetical protein JYG23_14630 [Sedimentibacter sp. zth1]
MKKKTCINTSILILISLILSTFCGCSISSTTDTTDLELGKREEDIDQEQNDDKSNITEEAYNPSPDVVHIWAYQDECSDAKRLIPKIENYCKQNNIPVQIHCYLKSEITYDDYILKRNINLGKANTIVCGGFNEMKNLNTKHADYSNVSSFSNIADSCKDLPYILIAYSDYMTLINKKLLNFYDIEYDKEIINKKEYYDLIQQLINKGAKLNSDIAIYESSARLLMEKYNLMLCNIDSENSIDDTYKENLTKAVQEFVDINEDKKEIKNNDACGNKIVIDENTNLRLNVGFGSMVADDNRYYTDYSRQTLIKSLKDTMILFEPYNIRYAIYIGENVTNKDTYNVVNYMMSTDIVKNNISLSRLTLKNDCEDKMYSMSSTEATVEDEEEYYIENAQEFVRIENILKDNILNGNINKDFINELMISTYNINLSVETFLINAILYCIQHPDEDVQSYFDKKLDVFLTNIKLRM